MLSNETVINNAVLSKKGIYCAEGAVLESFSDISGKLRRFIKKWTPQGSKMGLVNRVNNVNRKKSTPRGSPFSIRGRGVRSPFPKRAQVAGNPDFNCPRLISDPFSSPKAPKRLKSREFPLTAFSQWQIFGTEKLKKLEFSIDNFSSIATFWREKVKNRGIPFTTFGRWPVFGVTGPKS